MKDKVFSQSEVNELLKRAVELQGKEHGDVDGLTISELTAIAEESGISAEAISKAARELGHTSSKIEKLPSEVSSTHNHVSRFLPIKMSDEAWSSVVAELKHRYDSTIGLNLGTVKNPEQEQRGNLYEWRHTSASGIETRALMKPVKKGYHLQMSQRVGLGSQLFEGIGYGSLLGLIIGTIGVARLDISWLLPIAVILSIIGVYYLDGYWRRKKHLELERVANIVSSDLMEVAEVQIGSDGNASKEQELIDPETLDNAYGTESESDAVRGNKDRDRA